jgi:hypothetical protein
MATLNPHAISKGVCKQAVISDTLSHKTPHLSKILHSVLGALRFDGGRAFLAMSLADRAGDSRMASLLPSFSVLAVSIRKGLKPVQ